MAGWPGSTASRARRLVEWYSARGVIRIAHAYVRPPRHERDCRSLELGSLRTILVLRLDEIGDVVLTSAFLRELRANAVGARITLLVKPQVRNLVELCPHVDSIISFSPASSRIGRTILNMWGAMRLARGKLRDDRLDLAIMPRWDTDTVFGSFIAYLSGARWRATYSERVGEEKTQLNPGLDRLFTHVLEAAHPEHEVRRNLQLLEFLGGNVTSDDIELWLDDSDRAEASRVLGLPGGGEPVIALGVGAGHPKRIWPLDRFESVARGLLGSGYRIAVVGGPEERAMGDELRTRLGARVVNAAGTTTLRQTAALLGLCRLYVGNDAGPMHLAAAAGTPIVEISCHPCDGAATHSNSPVRFGPWNVRHEVLQPHRGIATCRLSCEGNEPHCILGVSVQSVASAANTMLNLRPA